MMLVFHGHKGGTGRSAAVANVAPVLSSAGYRVLVVDFDLEAPGIHRFFGLTDKQTLRGGVLDLVEDYGRALDAGTPLLTTFDAAMLLDPHFEAVKTPAREKLSADQVRERILGASRMGEDAWVKVLPAGRIDGDYRSRVARIRWDTLYAQPAWRAFFGWFKETLTGLADIVLVDARAGVTDMGALCLFALADRAVLLTPPTHQGLDGTLETADALARAGAAAARHGLVFVASRVSADADREHLGAWLAEARRRVSEPKRLGLWTVTRGHADPKAAAEAMVEDLRLPEVPVHAVGEPLVALRMLQQGVQRDALADAHAQLGRTIRRWIAETSLFQSADELRARIEAARRGRDLDAQPLLWARLAEVLLGDPPDPAGAAAAREAAESGAALAAALSDRGAQVRAIVLTGRASLALGEVERATSTLERAVELARSLDPRDPALLGDALFRWGEALDAGGGSGRAVAVLSESLAELGSVAPRPSAAIVRVLLAIFLAKMRMGRFEEAHPAARAAVDEARKVLVVDHRLLADAFSCAAATSGGPDSASPDGPELLVEALAHAEAIRPLDHALLGTVHHRASWPLAGSERRRHAAEAVRHWRRAVPERPASLSAALNALGVSTPDAGAAVALLVEAEAMARRARPVSWPEVVYAVCNLAQRGSAGSDKLDQLWREVVEPGVPLPWGARRFLASVLLGVEHETSLPRARHLLDTLNPPDTALEQQWRQLHLNLS